MTTLTKNMDNLSELSLMEFLNEYKVQKSNKMEKVPISHTSMGVIKGSYYIPDEKYPKFLELYKDYIEEGGEISLVERPREVGPLVIDVDFKTKKASRAYNIEHVKKTIKIYNQLIKKYVNITDDEQLECYLHEKDSPTEEDKGGDIIYKDGFHLLYPKLPISVKLRYLLYDKFMEYVEENNIIKDIPYENSFSDIFDASVLYANGILMYGASKIGRTPYTVTKVFNSNIKEEDIGDFTISDFIDFSCLRNFSDDDCIGLRDDSVEMQEMVDKISNSYGGSGRKKKVETSAPKMKTVTTYDNEGDNTNSNTNTTNTKANTSNDIIEYARQLSEILSPDRATSYEPWVRVGWALHNIDKSLLSAFMEFSKKTTRNNFDSRGCENVWKQAKNSGYALPSLLKWAREDNKELFFEIIKNRSNDLMAKTRSGTHDDLACVLHEIYGDIYKCIDLKNNEWYEFQNHHWVEIEQGLTLDQRISGEFAVLFSRTTQTLARNNLKSFDEHFANDDDSLLNNKMLKIYSKLKDETFKEKVMKACKKKFYDKKFRETLDENPYLLGFQNGVYDLKEGTFREGVPEDRVSATTGYDYIEYKENSPEVKMIEKYFSEVLTNKNVREYFMMYMSSCLLGQLKDQKFVIWTGTGSNAKTLTINFINSTLGVYASNLPTTVLTQKRGKVGQATPELADKYMCRFVYMEESEKAEKIQVGQMKEITGGGKLYARPLFGKPFYYKPKFKLVLCCNDLPEIPSNDGGTWRRIRVVNFDSKFVVNPDPRKKNQFKIDPNIEDRLNTLAPAFMWILLKKYFPVYQKNNFSIKEPEEVLAASLSYQKSNDKYLEWFEEQVENCDEGDRADISEFYQTFKHWYQMAFDEAPPKKKDFIDYLSKKYKVEKSRFVYGIRMKIMDDDYKDALD